MLEVITGPMFSGKTEELIRRYHRLRYAVPKVKIHAYKPKRDNRSVTIETHCGETIPSINLEDLLPLDMEDGDWILIDEFQFAPDDGWRILANMASGLDRNILIAGLTLDSRGKPFGPMASVLPYADNISCLTAVCRKCGKDATKTQRLEKGGEQIMIGAGEAYEARCNRCWVPR